ncbi:MAG: hypothetical protein EOM26_11515 [Alphaproteobacteria bacterium]|nr:hypothetical protein [Alphaproteobacteria bacterium]
MVDKDRVSIGRQIAGFIATLVLVPILFVGTCVPLGLSVGQSGAQLAIISIAVYCVAFTGFLLWRAIVTDNAGTRGALILILLILVLIGVPLLNSIF